MLLLEEILFLLKPCPSCLVWDIAFLSLEIPIHFFFWFLFLSYCNSKRFYRTSSHWYFFHWNLSKSNSYQVSNNLLRNLADLNNAVTWMVMTFSLISSSSVPFASLYGTFLGQQAKMVPSFKWWFFFYLNVCSNNSPQIWSTLKL